jgi:hypothetical protein
MSVENIGGGVGDCAQSGPSLKDMGMTIMGGLTKQRYGELVQLGLKASEELTKHGLQRSDYCEFGRIMEKIMQLE